MSMITRASLSIGPFYLGKPSQSDRLALERKIPSLPGSFPFNGITKEPNEGIEKRPELKGWIVNRKRAKIGEGMEAYRKAMKALNNWENINLDWFSTNAPPLQTSAPVVVTAQTLFLWSLLPLKVIYIDKDTAVSTKPSKPSFFFGGSENKSPTVGKANGKKGAGVRRRMAFGHSTVDGHQLCAEESFTLQLMDDESVYYEILAVSRPANLISALSLPLLLLIQQKFASDSVNAMKRAITS